MRWYLKTPLPMSTPTVIFDPNPSEPLADRINTALSILELIPDPDILEVPPTHENITERHHLRVLTGFLSIMSDDEFDLFPEHLADELDNVKEKWGDREPTPDANADVILGLVTSRVMYTFAGKVGMGRLSCGRVMQAARVARMRDEDEVRDEEEMRVEEKMRDEEKMSRLGATNGDVKLDPEARIFEPQGVEVESWPVEEDVVEDHPGV